MNNKHLKISILSVVLCGCMALAYPSEMSAQTVTNATNGATSSTTTAKSTTVEQPKFKRYFEDRTLRIYYYREGNRRHDTIYLSRFVSKSGEWAGSQTVLLDPFNYGDYRVVVKEHASGRELYSRTYNTLFREYCDTPTGADSVVRFEEVALVPWPKVAVEICMQKRGADQQFHTASTFHFIPGETPTQTVTSSDTQSVNIILQRSGDVHKKMDVVIVAEGYGPNDGRKMKRDFLMFNNYLLAKEPFKGRCDDFNVWGIGKTAQESGITNPGKSLSVNSTVGATYYTFGSDRYLMTFHLFQLHDVLDKVPYDHIIIMANSEVYGGGAIYNFYAVSAVQPMSEYILPPELGHSIGGLADEYVDPTIAYNEMHRLDVEPTEPNITTMVDFSGKWGDLIPQGTPIPTPPCKLDTPTSTCGTVGVYEGGGYQAKGIYRPVMNCMMNYYAPFCPVCTRALNAIFDIYTH